MKTAMNSITETAYAKINLGLDILGKREDGYHEVSMIMQSVSLHDTVTITEGGAGEISISTDLPGLSCGKDNLAEKRALLAAHCAIIPERSHSFEQKIFLAAGLAGGKQ